MLRSSCSLHAFGVQLSNTVWDPLDAEILQLQCVLLAS